jgi:hypothetical protein
MELETRKLLGYEIKLLPIEDFKQYYNECKNFSSFSEKAFLKSIGIPPVYFKEQPVKTQKDLLDNQEETVERKYSGKFILILTKDNEVLNCCRIDYDEMDLAFERLTPIETNVTPVKDHIKEGIVTVFVSRNDLEKGQYNQGVFIDYPVMLNKLPEVHTGTYYIPNDNDNEEHYLCNYSEDTKIDYSDYTNLNLLISDKLDQITSEGDVDKPLLREIDEMLVKLYEKKVIPKGFIKKVSKFIFKNEIQVTTVSKLVNILLSYDLNLPAYKATRSLRRCEQVIGGLV